MLPAWLWAGGLALAAMALLWSVAASRGASPQALAYRAALGALMLAAMSVPLGPLGYHLSLLGVVGVLLGPAASFQVVAVVSGTLALFGHGGLTVVGLNALVMGAGAAVARPAYAALEGKLPAGSRGAIATVAGQLVSGALLLALVAPSPGPGHAEGVRPLAQSGGIFAALGLPLWLAGVALEAGVAYGVVRFLERVRPGLLPARTEAPS